MNNSSCYIAQLVTCAILHFLVFLILYVYFVYFTVARVSVTVVGNGETVADGETPLTLTCTVGDANPAVSGFIWTGPGVGTETSESVILRPTRDHDGFAVTCIATNTVGSATSPAVMLDLQCMYVYMKLCTHKHN